MNVRRRQLCLLLSTSCLVLLMLACGLGPQPGAPTDTPTPTSQATEPPAAPTATPTPTPLPPASISPTPTQIPNRCEGLSGEIEVRVLVGPADAVGLEPEAVGKVPFSVTSGEAPYIVAGGGSITYANTLVEEWGTYDVTLDMDLAIAGECIAGENDEQLQLVIDMSGDQMVEVNADNFHGEYPWAGSASINAVFPLVEGATVEGEGWIFVLHLGSPEQ